MARIDTVTLTSGSNQFTDASAVATDVGEPVTSTASGFPSNATVVSVVVGHGDHFGQLHRYDRQQPVTFPNAVDSQPPGSQLSNGFGTVDFAISSRAAKTTKGNCPLAGTGGTNDELACDTFWGVAADGVQVFTFDSTDGSFPAAGLTGTDLFNIWECNITTWGALPEYSTLTNPPPANAPIVPWSMNSSGPAPTRTSTTTWPPTTAGRRLPPTTRRAPTVRRRRRIAYAQRGRTTATRELSAGTLPLENDVKPLLQDVQQNYNGGAGITTSNALSTNNPANWIWFGSNGLMSAYPYLSQPSLFGTQFNSAEVDIAGVKPTSLTIGGNASGSVHATYPVQRTLSIVTQRSYADCPAVTAGTCVFNNAHTDSVTLTNGSNQFTDASATGCGRRGGDHVRDGRVPGARHGGVGRLRHRHHLGAVYRDHRAAASVTYAFGPLDGNGTTNLNVLGPTSGKAGAIREFVRAPLQHLRREHRPRPVQWDRPWSPRWAP